MMASGACSGERRRKEARIGSAVAVSRGWMKGDDWLNERLRKSLSGVLLSRFRRSHVFLGDLFTFRGTNELKHLH